MSSFDPLSSSFSTGFGNDDVLNPPWPTTPHAPESVPAIFGASAIPPAPEKGPISGLYGREPRIYGQPEPGLISPRENMAASGTSFEKREPYLRVRITGLDRNRRDILIKLDAQVSPHVYMLHPLKYSASDQPFQFCQSQLSQCISLVLRIPTTLRSHFHE